MAASPPTKDRAVGVQGRGAGQRTHCCVGCEAPISFYGRCAPCLHVYCLACASEMAQCYICTAPITKVERISREAGLFISPVTLQGFRSEADFERHGRQLYAQLALLLAGGAGSSGGAAQAASASVYGRAPPPPPPPPHVAQQQALYQQQAQQHYMQQQHVMQHMQRLTQARQLQQHSQLQASRQRGGGGGSA